MDSMSSRYALAMFDIAVEKDKLPFVLECAKTFRKLVLSNKELISYFSSRFVTQDEHEKFIDETFVGFDVEFLSLIKIVIKNHRSNYLLDIIDSLISMGNEKLNILEGKIISTIKLDESKINEIEEVLSNKLKQKVELKNDIDESILGGVKVTINDRVFDGSVQSRLTSLKNNLKERRAS